MKTRLKKQLSVGLILSLLVLLLAACGKTEAKADQTNGNSTVKELSLTEIEAKAKEEGSVVSVVMADT